MSLARQRRLQVLSANIGAMPIAEGVVQQAFERFRESGELPDEPRLAATVVERCLQIANERRPKFDLETNIRNFANLLDQIEAGQLRDEPEPLREHLFHEAVRGEGFVQAAARSALKALVGRGEDVTDPNFLHDVKMPDYGTVGLHILKFPALLAKAPNATKARRLFKRFAALRKRIEPTDHAWFESLAKAGRLFRTDGVLPDGTVMRKAVQANAELFALIENTCADDVVGALLAAAQSDDVSAARVLLCRVSASWAEPHDKVVPTVGPPVPEGRALFDWARKCVKFWQELLPTLPAQGAP